MGPTDPKKWQPWHIRYMLGTDLMHNAAHASDSPERWKVEAEILGFERNPLPGIIAAYHPSKGGDFNGART